MAAQIEITHFLTKEVLTRVLKDEEKMYVFVIGDVRRMYEKCLEDVYKMIKDEGDGNSIPLLAHKMNAS